MLEIKKTPIHPLQVDWSHKPDIGISILEQLRPCVKQGYYNNLNLDYLIKSLVTTDCKYGNGHTLFAFATDNVLTLLHENLQAQDIFTYYYVGDKLYISNIDVLSDKSLQYSLLITSIIVPDECDWYIFIPDDSNKGNISLLNSTHYFIEDMGKAFGVQLNKTD